MKVRREEKGGEERGTELFRLSNSSAAGTPRPVAERKKQPASSKFFFFLLVHLLLLFVSLRRAFPRKRKEMKLCSSICETKRLFLRVSPLPHRTRRGSSGRSDIHSLRSVPSLRFILVSQVLSAFFFCSSFDTRRKEETKIVKNHLFLSSLPLPPLSSASSSASASSFDITKSVNASGCLTMHACIASKAPRHSGALAPPPPLLLLLPALAPVPACCKEVDLRKHEKAATKEGPQGPSRKSAMQGHARASWMFLSTCSGVSGAPSLLEEEAEAEASVFCLFVGARSGPNF